MTEITCHKSQQTHYCQAWTNITCHKSHQTFLHNWLSTLPQLYGTQRFFTAFTTARYLCP